MNEECFAVDAAQRIVNLLRDGCPISAVQIAINRSSDEFSLVVNIGIIEDLFALGIISNEIMGQDQ